MAHVLLLNDMKIRVRHRTEPDTHPCGQEELLKQGKYKCLTVPGPPPGIRNPGGEWVVFIRDGMQVGALPKSEFDDVAGQRPHRVILDR